MTTPTVYDHSTANIRGGSLARRRTVTFPSGCVMAISSRVQSISGFFNPTESSSWTSSSPKISFFSITASAILSTASLLYAISV